MLEEEAWAANRIISDLVDYARVRKSQPAMVSLAHLVDQVLAGNPPPHGIAVKRDVPELDVRVDELQTVSALGNLVRNAWEAMSSGGMLKLEAHEEGPYGVLALEDSGPGFAPEIESRLFEPLVTTKPLGLGLGLTVCRTIIRVHRGTLWAENNADGGASFHFVLPPAESTEA